MAHQPLTIVLDSAFLESDADLQLLTLRLKGVAIPPWRPALSGIYNSGMQAVYNGETIAVAFREGVEILP
jgi:hypothetical protein